ncbi:MAG: hypothetical protein JO073_13500 [Actinobacteria bacterium]|nr:hypothetical protein [Actinomycetota bacterium]
MTHGPDFDELIGGDVGGPERERLRRAHELLLVAGPPPELSPELEAGPTLALTLGRDRGAARFRRRAALLLAAALAVAIVFIGGYAAGNRNTGTNAAGPAWKTLSLHGASGAVATLRIERAEQGNWPMTLAVQGLPQLPQHGYYEVYLARNGRAWAPCGTFVVGRRSTGLTVRLNAPYELERGDTWIVTKQLPGENGVGPTVLQ